MSGGEIFRLAYVSRNLGVADAAGLEAILAVSRRNNARDGVTGALLFSERCFAQVLEGPLAAVSQTFERIQLDERHGEVTVLLSERGAARRFGDWAMAYAGEDGDARARFAAMDFDSLRGRATGEDGRALLATLDGAVGRSAVFLPG